MLRLQLWYGGNFILINGPGEPRPEVSPGSGTRRLAIVSRKSEQLFNDIFRFNAIMKSNALFNNSEKNHRDISMS